MVTGCKYYVVKGKEISKKNSVRTCSNEFDNLDSALNHAGNEVEEINDSDYVAFIYKKVCVVKPKKIELDIVYEPDVKVESDGSISFVNNPSFNEKE